jgi:divalent metal cation (Fe/Co/Zn/Cd) transporter
MVNGVAPRSVSRRSFSSSEIAGLFVVLAILVSAFVALYETIQRFIHSEQLMHLWVLAAAGVIGFVGNEIAAQVRLRAAGACRVQR